jgi:hypothetical protein
MPKATKKSRKPKKQGKTQGGAPFQLIPSANAFQRIALSLPKEQSKDPSIRHLWVFTITALLAMVDIHEHTMNILRELLQIVEKTPELKSQVAAMSSEIAQIPTLKAQLAELFGELNRTPIELKD